MADRAHLATDKELSKVLRSLNIARFDELDIITLEHGTDAQKLKAAKKDIDDFAELFVIAVMAFFAQGILTIGAMTKRIHVLNLDYMNGVLGVNAEPEPKLPKLDKNLAKKVDKEIRKTLEKAIRQGDDPLRRANGLAQKYQNLAKMVARTEATRAENKARLDAMLEAEKQGRHIQKKWAAVLDKVTRDTHRRIHGETQPLDEPFSNGLMYPCEQGAPPAECCNCRCTISAVKLDNSAESGIIGSDGGEMYRKTRNTGEFEKLSEPMQLRHVKAIAEKYGIDLKDIGIKIERDPTQIGSKIAGAANEKYTGKGRIHLFPDAFKSEEELVRTIFHEKVHLEHIATYGRDYITANHDYFETIADKLEDEFFKASRKRR